MTMLDVFSRYFIAVPLMNENSEAYTDALITTLYGRFGWPVEILADNANVFKEGSFAKTLDRLGIRQPAISPYSPWGNPVERWHKDLNKSCKAFILKGSSERWHLWLPIYALKRNLTPVTALG